LTGDKKITTVRPGSSPKLQNAVLEDIPGDYDPENPNKPGLRDVVCRFQTYAVAKAGPDKGKIYGGISWGFQVDVDGNVTSLPRKFIATPTDVFKQAVKRWDEQAVGPIERRNSDKQMPLGPDINFNLK
jgi:hypothetical protein